MIATSFVQSNLPLATSSSVRIIRLPRLRVSAFQPQSTKTLVFSSAPLSRLKWTPSQASQATRPVSVPPPGSSTTAAPRPTWAIVPLSMILERLRPACQRRAGRSSCRRSGRPAARPRRGRAAACPSWRRSWTATSPIAKTPGWSLSCRSASDGNAAAGGELDAERLGDGVGLRGRPPRSSVRVLTFSPLASVISFGPTSFTPVPVCTSTPRSSSAFWA